MFPSFHPSRGPDLNLLSLHVVWCVCVTVRSLPFLFMDCTCYRTWLKRERLPANTAAPYPLSIHHSLLPSPFSAAASRVLLVVCVFLPPPLTPFPHCALALPYFVRLAQGRR